MDINSQCLASIFPKMRDFASVRDVIFDISIPVATIEITQEGLIQLKASVQAVVSTTDYGK